MLVALATVSVAISSSGCVCSSFKGVVSIEKLSFPLFAGKQSDQRFYKLTSTPLQKARIQKFSEYFPTNQNTTCLKYPVSVGFHLPIRIIIINETYK